MLTVYLFVPDCGSLRMILRARADLVRCREHGEASDFPGWFDAGPGLRFYADAWLLAIDWMEHRHQYAESGLQP